MKTIRLKNESAGKFFKELAIAFGTKSARTTVEISPGWGQGEISCYDLKNGITLFLYKCRFDEDVHFHFTECQGYPLVMSYCLEGVLEAFFVGSEDKSTANAFESIILVNQDNRDYILRFKKDIQIKATSIKINREKFYETYYHQFAGLETDYDRLFNIEKGEDSYFHNHMYSVVLSRYFKEIEESKLQGVSHEMHVQGVVMQIISEQLNLYKDDINEDGAQRILRQYEISCVNQAAKIIEDELEELETIKEISYRIGINTNKLQDGFKLLYSNTINGYVQEVRLKRGAQLLHYSDLTISQIVGELGLKSNSYFSRIFKEAYGITPSEYRKKKWDGK